MAEFPALLNIPQSLLCFSGPDVWTLLQGAISNDIQLLKKQKTLRAFHLNPKGKWIARLLLFLKDEKIYALTSPVEAENLKNSMKNLIFLSESQLEDLTPQTSIFLQVAEKSEQLSDEVIPDEEWAKPAGWILIPASERETFLARHAWPLWTNADSEAFQIESKIPRYGLEVDEKTIPPQVGYGDNYFSYTKGCYVGQEIISRLKHYGKNPS